MATPAQLAANLQNAQRSTGPRSVEGKAASCFNALKHGLDAQSSVIPGEDLAARQDLTRDYYAQFQPVGPLETCLVETLIRADWNMRRFTRLESQVLNALLAGQEPSDYPLGAAILRDTAGSNALDKVGRRLESAQRAWFRARKELRATQKDRLENDASLPDALPEPEPAAAGCAATSVSPPAPGPEMVHPGRPAAQARPTIGFVPLIRTDRPSRWNRDSLAGLNSVECL